MIADRITLFRPWLYLMKCILNHSEDCIHSVINYVADCGGHRHDEFYQLFINISPAELTQKLKMITCCHSHLLGSHMKRSKFGNSGLAQT